MKTSFSHHVDIDFTSLSHHFHIRQKKRKHPCKHDFNIISTSFHVRWGVVKLCSLFFHEVSEHEPCPEPPEPSPANPTPPPPTPAPELPAPRLPGKGHAPLNLCQTVGLLHVYLDIAFQPRQNGDRVQGLSAFFQIRTCHLSLSCPRIRNLSLERMCAPLLFFVLML